MIKYLFYGFLAALQFLFITLKLTAYIDWGWFLVMSPVLIPLAIIVVTLQLMSSIGGLCYLVDEHAKKK